MKKNISKKDIVEILGDFAKKNYAVHTESF